MLQPRQDNLGRLSLIVRTIEYINTQTFLKRLIQVQRLFRGKQISFREYLIFSISGSLSCQDVLWEQVGERCRMLYIKREQVTT